MRIFELTDKTTDPSRHSFRRAVMLLLLGLLSLMTIQCRGQAPCSEFDSMPARRVTYENDDEVLLDDHDPNKSTTDDIHATEAHDYARETDRFFRKLREEGFGIWDGCYGGGATERIMTSRVHDEGTRAWFVGGSYAESLFNDDFITPEIVAHEWTHGVVGRAVNILPTDGENLPSGQSGALFESIPDVFAVLITGDYELQSKLGLERSLKNPTNPENPDQQANHWVDYDDHGNSEKCHPREDIGECRVKYYQAGIPSYAAYLIMEGGTHPAERREKDSVIYEPITVTGIGRDKVARIYFHALNRDYILDPKYKKEGGPANFETFANGVIQACQDIANGKVEVVSKVKIDLDDCQEVENAFLAVGMLRPQASSPPNGRWTGSVSQPDASAYTLGMSLQNCSQQAVCGEIDYPELSCGGTLTFLDSQANQYRFREKITYGADGCADEGTITMQPNADGSWFWRWHHSRYGEATATLQKTE